MVASISEWNYPKLFSKQALENCSILGNGATQHLFIERVNNLRKKKTGQNTATT